MMEKNDILQNELLRTLSFIEWMDYEKILLDLDQDFLQQHHDINREMLEQVLQHMTKQGFIISEVQNETIHYKRVMKRNGGFFRRLFARLFTILFLLMHQSCQAKEKPRAALEMKSVLSSTKDIILSDKQRAWYKAELPELESVVEFTIPDPVNPDGPVNTKLLQVLDKNKKTLGFIREVTTTTGCNDGCYPIIFTLFCGPKGEYVGLKSGPGLTKRDHEPMSAEDLFKLDLVIRTNPPEFKTIQHPKEMVDALTGETKPAFVGKVVPKAAYSSYRITLYFEQTKKVILKLNLGSSSN